MERREIQYNKPSEGRAAHIRAALPFLFGTMGFSIPGAFAAKLLNPDKKVLAVCGDGGFMMNSQELETAVREKVPFVTLIWEDSSYGLIKWKEQEQLHGEDCYVDFTNPDFKMLAEAMHCKGYRVEKAEDLIPHTGRSVPAECAQRHRGAGGLQ